MDGGLAFGRARTPQPDNVKINKERHDATRLNTLGRSIFILTPWHMPMVCAESGPWNDKRFLPNFLLVSD